MFKVIGTGNQNRDYQPQRQYTLALDFNSASKIADSLNSTYGAYVHHEVVEAETELNLDSTYDLISEDMPYEYWSTLTGASALPQHVAEYWYKTTILKQKV